MELGELPRYYQLRIKVNDHGCWIWTGPFRNSYGCAFDGYRERVNGKTGRARTVYAHRRVKEWALGRKLKRVLEDCDHTCPNKLCVNPDHIEIRSRSAHIKRHVKERFPPPYAEELLIARQAKQKEALAKWKTEHPERWREIRKQGAARKMARLKEARRIARELFPDNPEARRLAVSEQYERLKREKWLCST